MAADDGGQIEISDPTRLPSRPLVSVVMVTYNHAAYLDQAIAGVLRQQTDFEVELLIGEDCSTDGTRQIALRYQNEYPQLIRIITSEHNVGGHNNWRRLLFAARGEFIAHNDGDDYWLDGKLQAQIDYLRQHPDCVASYTNAQTVDEGGAPIGVFNDAGRRRFDLAALLRSGNVLNSSSMVFRVEQRKALLEIEGVVLDYRMHLRHACADWLDQLPQTLAVYRVNSAGSAVARTNDRIREYYWEAILDVPRHLVTDAAFASGIADFMRRVLFRAVRGTRWQLLREWSPRVFAASPYGKVRTAIMILNSVIRTLWNMLTGLFRRGADGRRLRVLHRC